MCVCVCLSLPPLSSLPLLSVSIVCINHLCHSNSLSQFNLYLLYVPTLHPSIPLPFLSRLVLSWRSHLRIPETTCSEAASLHLSTSSNSKSTGELDILWEHTGHLRYTRALSQCPLIEGKQSSLVTKSSPPPPLVLPHWTPQ